ncbi:MAG: hypothetical protein A3A97_00615 [Candidatus Terrybacteria bacterium RIFCSPLOWO2_01_FULL_40_23]|uniref:Uncharacterized protein n=1 Tax=Candidatus Terrybacteria bacterium RIFCSPLOWO2_01_FULL_40_23 TaxID=1802366 RepID=A0A1G2PUP4_9BACT|nr:MAG: hypothetical protein A3A97_00615 [Candidatus Terrybacteria bacterium RIFCSPLOWO2_01_FULL_40_23]
MTIYSLSPTSGRGMFLAYRRKGVVMGKYDELTRGQTEALLNRIGGMDGMRGILSGELIVTLANASSLALGFARDMAKETGWTLLEDVSEPSEIAISSLELVTFLNRGESHVSGDTLRNRAKENGANFGQRQAEYLLERQDEIPKEWRDFYLVFPGTVWRDSRGRRRVPSLNWIGGRWFLDFRWLDYDWDSVDRLVRPRK